MSARIHHLDCATMCPAAAPWLGLVDRHPGHLVAHCLLIEDPGGLILLDTGFGTGDVADPGRLGPVRRPFGMRPRTEETAVAQIRALGLDAGDVRHILLTHLDLDHAGGLGDFPRARVHVHRAELDAARARRRPDGLRYRPAQWSHGPDWATHAEPGEPWFGFERVRPLEGLDTEIAMLPLLGHTAGHSGFALRTEAGWMLHAGDAYLRHVEVQAGARVPPAIGIYHALNSHDRHARRANAERLTELLADHGDEVTMFCSHDPSGFAALGASGGVGGPV